MNGASNPPLLVVVCGLSFAGKTTLGTALARRFNYKQVDVDLTKVRLYGVRFEDNSLERDAWNRIYDETDSEIAHYPAVRNIGGRRVSQLSHTRTCPC